ncbi:hypothetical protein F5Y07DRAFT_349923 [Xylaria sp. FL0933]|nr:hypothetical protein F5Y07DRAFT_349923 [Xylaria sp. FL0933]
MALFVLECSICSRLLAGYYHLSHPILVARNVITLITFLPSLDGHSANAGLLQKELCREPQVQRFMQLEISHPRMRV